MKQHKMTFKTKEMAERFLNNYGNEIYCKKGYAPVRAYFDNRSETWQVTSTYLNAANDYLEELRERDVLRMPHHCTNLHKSKLVLKQLMFDIDSTVLRIISDIKADIPFADEMKRLDVLMSIARKMEGEDSHKNHVIKFLLSVIGNHIDMSKMANFERYFQKKVSCFKSSGTKEDDEDKKCAKINYSRFFGLMESIRKEISRGNT